MQNDLMANAALTATAGPGPSETAPVKIDNTIRQEWNNYVDWLEKKGLKGHPSLDHNNLAFKMIDDYRKEHPDTPLTKDLVIPIQKEFSNYRDYALKQVDEKKAELAPGVTRDKFLSALSQVDGIPGQRTTSYKFPKGYMTDMDKGETKSGFMRSDAPATTQLAQLK